MSTNNVTVLYSSLCTSVRPAGQKYIVFLLLQNVVSRYWGFSRGRAAKHAVGELVRLWQPRRPPCKSVTSVRNLKQSLLSFFTGFVIALLYVSCRTQVHLVAPSLILRELCSNTIRCYAAHIHPLPTSNAAPCTFIGRTMGGLVPQGKWWVFCNFFASSIQHISKVQTVTCPCTSLRSFTGSQGGTSFQNTRYRPGQHGGMCWFVNEWGDSSYALKI